MGKFSHISTLKSTAPRPAFVAKRRSHDYFYSVINMENKPTQRGEENEMG